ncbi:MAG: hypothetical protein OXL96_13925 [Candidatus Poribacteria bacterium]|nr:hypothetical protein [Candidatus Poribacteria bacterium]
MKDERQQFNRELKMAKQMHKYNADYDMTMVIRYAFALFGLFLLQLFVLELLRWRTSENLEDGGYLTPEITHTIFGFIGGWIAAIVTFLAKRLADQKPATTTEEAEEQK